LGYWLWGIIIWWFWLPSATITMAVAVAVAAAMAAAFRAPSGGAMDVPVWLLPGVPGVGG
jgi:hypothetical protein